MSGVRGWPQEQQERQGAKKSKAKDDVDKYLKDRTGSTPRASRRSASTSATATTSTFCPTTAASRPYLKDYIEFMGWDDLNWLEDVHMGYEEGRPAIFDRNINGWVRIPKEMKLPDNQQDRDMLARELLVRFQTSPNHPWESNRYEAATSGLFWGLGRVLRRLKRGSPACRYRTST